MVPDKKPVVLDPEREWGCFGSGHGLLNVADRFCQIQTHSIDNIPLPKNSKIFVWLLIVIMRQYYF